ncbi:MAG: hypothetical protein AUH43_12470 [Acidobacteria bacterium 13_1_40CM_65_14]|nr:MAG: hypothetical protein AUH43_12470 [Acidobacteria bacterium 13_1_40CM_65_14]
MMSRGIVKPIVASLLVAAPLVAGACSSADGKTKDQSGAAAAAVAVAPAVAVEQPIARFMAASSPRRSSAARRSCKVRSSSVCPRRKPMRS